MLKKDERQRARAVGDTIVAETERLLELESAFLISLASNGLPPDIIELLVRGNPMRGIPPRLLQKAIKVTTIPHHQPSEWRSVYNAAYPKFWGIETTDPAAVERGEETIVAPCMPEHAAKTIVNAYNKRWP